MENCENKNQHGGNDAERRLFEYFIVAGLDDRNELEELAAQPSDVRQASEPLAPITDICVVFTSSGETTPAGYERIETTPQGYPANLNHGSIRSSAAFLCYKRGYHKPPLIDLGVLDEGKGEKPMTDATIIDKTPYGLSANVSNSSQGLYFTTRRAKPDSPPHQLVITHICVILENKGEHPPHTYYKIPKNLNKSMIGSEVYVCYKKSQLACKRIAYKPSVLDCYPRVKNIDDSLVQNVPKFFLPMGALIEAWPERCKGSEQSARTVSTCVFTDGAYTKYYGASITFYEPYTKPLNSYQLEKLDLGADDSLPASASLSTLRLTQQQQDQSPKEKAHYYCNKAICIVSRCPFFEPFRRFLYFLLNTVAITEPSKLPIERYISHLMYEVPFPSPARPRVLVELGSDMVAFESSDDSQIPLTGANFVETLKCLGTENFIYAMLLTLLEQKILVHSLRPWLLACVAETLCALMFPFSWQLPYIPQCPISLSGIFHAPLSFIAGVDSRYFDLYDEPPSDVTCFDLDTATVSQSALRRLYHTQMFPKKPLKRLRLALEEIAGKISEKSVKKGGGDHEQMHMRRMQSELAIREAFLRFMCALMDGYMLYLSPIVGSPCADGATDVKKLFDWERFLQSRDKNSVEFYTKFRETTCFNRFIEERSGAIGGDDRSEVTGSTEEMDRSAYFVFFDDCVAAIRAENYGKEKGQVSSNSTRLLNSDSMITNRTVVVPTPHLISTELQDRNFVYGSFPHRFVDEFFETELITRSMSNRPTQQRRELALRRHNYYLLRTRQEIRKSLSDASLLTQQNVLHWPRSILFYAYTLWFMQLPSLVKIARNNRKMLILGMRVLTRMEQVGVPTHDQVCYRLLMHLCGEYGRPEMAITVLRKMLISGIIPNAITYKVYHQALMKGEWPSELRFTAISVWRRIQLRVEICAKFLSLLPSPDLSAVEHQIKDARAEDGFSNLEKDRNVPNHVEVEVVEDVSNIVQEIAELKVVENKTRCNNNCSDGSPLSDPLGAETAVASVEQKQQMQNNKSADHQKKQLKSITLPNPYLSPSREKFIKEHSASPFSREEENDEKRSLQNKKQKKNGSSWFRNFTTSSLVNTFIHRSQTTESLDAVSHDGSVNSEVPSASTSSTTAASSPNFFTLANKMRKKALRTYNEVMSQGVNDLIERSGINATQMFKEVKLNLSRSYRANQSGVSTASTSQDNIFANDTGTMDFFFLCTRQSREIVPIHYWMQDILPIDDSELRDVWIRKNDTDESFSQDEFLDVIVCSSSPCGNCEKVIYDDELILGWSVDDANMNSKCPHCQHNFLPSLKVCVRAKQSASPNASQLTDADKSHTTLNSSILPTRTGKIVQSLTIPYLSPLVLRRELETLIMSIDGPDILSRPSMRISHPILFWNLFYYCRRLELPTHLLTWVSPAVIIHCVQDMPQLPLEDDTPQSAQKADSRMP